MKNEGEPIVVFPGEVGERLCRECHSVLVSGEGQGTGLCMGCADAAS